MYISSSGCWVHLSIVLLMIGCGPIAIGIGDADGEVDADAEQEDAMPDSDSNYPADSDIDSVTDADSTSGESVYVPGGPYLRTMSQFDLVREVYVSPFRIDRFEVTNGQYRLCFESGACNEIAEVSFTHPDYFTNTLYDNYPVCTAQWTVAYQFCRWAGKRLPTEVEWEKAARGGCDVLGEDETCEIETDAPIYPWGNEDPGINCLFGNNFSACYGDTTEVGSFPVGVSPYGVYDMNGNVMEWVNDWYTETYPMDSPDHDPLGPTEEEAAGECPMSTESACHIKKGSPYYSEAPEDFPIENRYPSLAELFSYYTGFRCAEDVD